MSLDCEVAVVGGGPAGATIARLLARWGYRTIVVEAARGPRAKVGEVLAPSSRPVLAKLGLLQPLDEDPALARVCFGVLSDWGGPHRRDYLREPGGHGWIIDRKDFERRLSVEAISAGAEWRWNHRLARAASSPDRIELLLTTSDAQATRTVAISCAFAVDATGRAAALGRRLGARRRVATRRFARAVPAKDTLDMPGGGWIFISSRPDGWSYSAEGPGGARHDILFGELAPCSAAGESQRAWEAGFSLLDRACGHRWLAVGDAAAAFDPLTSQGLPQALSSGLVAAHTVRAALGGHALAVLDYQRAIGRTWVKSLRDSVAVYLNETRWAETPFWKDAQSPLVA